MSNDVEDLPNIRIDDGETVIVIEIDSREEGANAEAFLQAMAEDGRLVGANGQTATVTTDAGYGIDWAAVTPQSGSFQSSDFSLLGQQLDKRFGTAYSSDFRDVFGLISGDSAAAKSNAAAAAAAAQAQFIAAEQERLAEEGSEALFQADRAEKRRQFEYEQQKTQLEIARSNSESQARVDQINIQLAALARRSAEQSKSYALGLEGLGLNREGLDLSREGLGIEQEGLDLTQGDFTRGVSAGADPSRAGANAALGGPGSGLAEYARKVAALNTESDQSKIDLQGEQVVLKGKGIDLQEDEVDLREKELALQNQARQAAIWDQEASNRAALEAEQERSGWESLAYINFGAEALNRFRAGESYEDLARDYQDRIDSVSSDLGLTGNAVETAAAGASNAANGYSFDPNGVLSMTTTGGGSGGGGGDAVSDPANPDDPAYYEWGGGGFNYNTPAMNGPG